VGLAWHPTSHALWVAERGANGAAQLRTIVAQPPAATSDRGDKRGVAGAAYALPADAAPSALAFGGGDHFAETANSLSWPPRERTAAATAIRSSDDAADGAERLLQDVVDVVRSVAIAPDGVIYFATSNSLGRIVRN